MSPPPPRPSRRGAWRPLLRLIHAWAGAAVALVLITTGATGAVLVFVAEIFALETGALSPTLETPPGQGVDIGRIIKAAEAHAGEQFQPLGLLAPYSRLQVSAAMVYGWDGSDPTEREMRIVGVDPSDGAALGSFYLYRTFAHTLLDFHHDLLVGDIGLIFVAATAFIVVGLAISGLAVWWPVGGRALKKLGRTTRGVVLRPSYFSLHSVLGVWLAVLISVWVISGAYWAKPDWFSPLFDESWREFPSAAAEEFRTANCHGTVTPDDAARIASRVAGDRRIATMILPTSAADRFQVHMKGAGDLSDYLGDVVVWVHGTCPDVTHVSRLSEAGTGSALAHGMRSFHSGRMFGVIGIPITFAVGAAATAIGVTGFVLWVRRYVRPLGRTPRTGEAPGDSD